MTASRAFLLRLLGGALVFVAAYYVVFRPRLDERAVRSIETIAHVLIHLVWLPFDVHFYRRDERKTAARNATLQQQGHPEF